MQCQQQASQAVVGPRPPSGRPGGRPCGQDSPSKPMAPQAGEEQQPDPAGSARWPAAPPTACPLAQIARRGTAPHQRPKCPRPAPPARAPRRPRPAARRWTGMKFDTRPAAAATGPAAAAARAPRWRADMATARARGSRITGAPQAIARGAIDQPPAGCDQCRWRQRQQPLA